MSGCGDTPSATPANTAISNPSGTTEANTQEFPTVPADTPQAVNRTPAAKPIRCDDPDATLSDLTKGSYEYAACYLDAGAKSLHLEYTRTREETDGKTETVTFVGDAEGQEQANWHFTVKGVSSSSDGEWVVLDENNWYHKQGGAYVQKSPLPVEMTDEQLVIQDSRRSLAIYPGNSDLEEGAVPLEGTETIDGEETNHYKFTATAFIVNKDRQFDACVSKSTGNLVQVDIVSPNGKSKLNAKISKVDEPVTIPSVK